MTIVSSWTPPRGATEGPLSTLIPVFVDVETYVDETVSLGSMTLRQYLAKSHLTAIAVAIGEEEPEVLNAPEGEFDEKLEQTIEVLRRLALDPAYVFVAHNAAFDIRVLRFMLGVPQPCHVWCTMEGAMGAWPDLPGGYGLANCGSRLGLSKNKLELDLRLLGKLRNMIERTGRPILWETVVDPIRDQIQKVLWTAKLRPPAELTEDDLDRVLMIYNKRDVETMQELYYREIAGLKDVEQRVALMTHRVRRNYFKVTSDRLEELIVKLNLAAEKAEEKAEEYVSDDSDIRQIFNREEDGSLRSIRFARLKKVIQEKMDAPEIESTSMKKINPVQLAAHQNVAGLLEQTARASKMIFHKRRAEMFRNVDEVDAELGYMRAITGRFSSPSVGRGLNLHNVPKHDKDVAKPVRQLFRLPDHLCVVRGDLANVEYRVEGALTGCRTVIQMFENDVNADPYCEAWFHMTGQKIVKGMPIRQVSKSAVLGLGFQMSATGYAKVLLKAIASGDVTIDMLMAIAVELGWKDAGRYIDDIVTKLGCKRIVALAAFHIHRAFQNAHPEFNILAEWLVRAVQSVVNASIEDDQWDYAKRALDRMMTLPAAPDPNMLHLEVDEDRSFTHPSVRVRCGPWVHTLCWREPDMRRTMFEKTLSEPKLTIRKANGTMKPFTKQLAIENVTQAAARNSLCYGLLQLEKMGYHDILHVHDEVMLIVPKQREAVLKAKEDMLTVFGEKAKDKPLKWAVLFKPDEITVTQSLYEDENDVAVSVKDKKTGEKKPGPDRWGRIQRNELGCLENLP